MNIEEIFGLILIFAGFFFFFASAIGMIRMPDLYNRLQAATKTSTLGAMLTLLGIGVIWPANFFKIVVLIVFVLLTSPITGHALARSGYISGVPLYEKTVVDKYAGQKPSGGEKDD